jgi:hypothetical protein
MLNPYYIDAVLGVFGLRRVRMENFQPSAGHFPANQRNVNAFPTRQRKVLSAGIPHAALSQEPPNIK